MENKEWQEIVSQILSEDVDFSFIDNATKSGGTDDGDEIVENLFAIRQANEWLDDAKNQPLPKSLFDEFWNEGELSVLFADTNLGKSILAVQIAKSISEGTAIPGFKLEANKQPTIYFDFELTQKQFEHRYSADYADHYVFDQTFQRAEINPQITIPKKFRSFEEFLHSSLKLTATISAAKVWIIDNITYLNHDMERAKDALPLMKQMKALKNEFGLSILVLAHTPKRDLSKPITRNDLQGSKMLMSFCDSAFAIGESHKDKNVRYIKQIKTRNGEFRYDSDNVCLCQITKPHNFLQFELINHGHEKDCLRETTDKDRELLLQQATELNKQGKSYREIASALNISHMKVSRLLKSLSL